MQQPSPAMPVLLKQGYMERRTAFSGWKREYFRLLQDTIFAFSSHNSKIPLSELTLNDAIVEDVSWNMKKANAIKITSAIGKKLVLICESPQEHKQWYDALFYSTKIMQRAEYCSPLSGGWLHVREGSGKLARFVSRWFVIKDSFLLCYKSREDMTSALAHRILNSSVQKWALAKPPRPPSSLETTPCEYGSGKMTQRQYVLPLMGSKLVFYRSEMPWSFAIQLYKAGELCSEHILAASSQAMMNVWMEVLYVSMGYTPPQMAKEKGTSRALFEESSLSELQAVETPIPVVTKQGVVDPTAVANRPTSAGPSSVSAAGGGARPRSAPSART